VPLNLPRKIFKISVTFSLGRESLGIKKQERGWGANPWESKNKREARLRDLGMPFRNSELALDCWSHFGAAVSLLAAPNINAWRQLKFTAFKIKAL
jgi:hypothetical protein